MQTNSHAETIHDAFCMHVPIYTKVGSAYLFQNAVKITQQVRDKADSYRAQHSDVPEFAWKHLQHAPALLLVQGKGIYQKLTPFYLHGQGPSNTGQQLLGMRTFYGKQRSEDMLINKRLFENFSSIFIGDQKSFSRNIIFDHYVCFPERIECNTQAILQEQCQKIVLLQRAVVQRLIRNIHAIITKDRSITGVLKPHRNLSISKRILQNCILFEVE